MGRWFQIWCFTIFCFQVAGIERSNRVISNSQIEFENTEEKARLYVLRSIDTLKIYAELLESIRNNSKDASQEELDQWDFKITFYNGMVSLRENKLNECLNWGLKGLKKVNANTDSATLCLLYSNILAVPYRRFGKSDSAIYYFQKSAQLAEKLNDQKQLANMYHNMALVHSDMLNFRKAVESLMKVEPLYASDSNLVGLATLYNTLGSVYIKLGESHNAIKYLLQAERICKRINNQDIIPYVDFNLASAYQNIDLHGKAIDYLYKGYAGAKRLNDKILIANSLNSFSVHHGLIGNTDSALYYGDSAYRLSLSLRDIRWKSAMLANLMQLYSSIDNFAIVEKYGKELLNHSNQQNNLIEYAKGLKLYALASYKLGKFDKSAELYGDYILLQDSIEELMSRQKVYQIEAKYAYQNKATIDSLNLVNERYKNALELEQKDSIIASVKSTQFLLFLGCSILLILLAVIGLNIKRIIADKKTITLQKKRLELRHNELLEKRNELKDANAQLESLNKDLEMQVVKRTEELTQKLNMIEQHTWKLSHEIRGPLTTLMGLISILQNAKYSDDEKEDALNKLDKMSIKIDSLIKSLSSDLDR